MSEYNQQDVERIIYWRTIFISNAIGRLEEILSYAETPLENKKRLDKLSVPFAGIEISDELSRKIKQQKIQQYQAAGITPFSELQ